MNDDENTEAAPDPQQASAGDKPLEAEMETADEGGIFPPDINPTVDIGGGPEEQAALEDEYRHPQPRP